MWPKTAINGPCCVLPPRWGGYTFSKRKSKTVIFSTLQTCKRVPHFCTHDNPASNTSKQPASNPTKTSILSLKQ